MGVAPKTGKEQRMLPNMAVLIVLEMILKTKPVMPIPALVKYKFYSCNIKFKLFIEMTLKTKLVILIRVQVLSPALSNLLLTYLRLSQSNQL